MLKFAASQFGRTNYENHGETLKFKIVAFCESGYCDKNVTPLMAVLNLVDISCLTR